jgi:guanylate kinase
MIFSLATGKIIVITAPSGSGKTTLVKRLLQTCPQLAFSISACTRTPRPGEEHGKDYYFYSEEDFKKLIEENAFVEWEMVYTGKYYGTLKSELERIWSNQQHPLVDIDVKGALAIHDVYPQHALSIFIQAPSLDELRKRLQLRGTETEHSLEERISKAEYELSFANQFDRILVNDDLETATRELVAMVTGYLGK